MKHKVTSQIKFNNHPIKYNYGFLMLQYYFSNYIENHKTNTNRKNQI